MPAINNSGPLPYQKPPEQAPPATSGYGPKGELQSQVQGVQGFAPSNLSELGQYFQRFQPDTRMPMQATASQQLGAFAEKPSRPLRHDSGNYGPKQAEVPQDEWVMVPAMRRLSMGGPSGLVQVRRDSQAAQQTGLGVVGY